MPDHAALHPDRSNRSSLLGAIAVAVLALTMVLAASAEAAIYWANGNSGTIGRADADGGNVNQSFVTGASNPAGVTVDAGHVYWANVGSKTIGRAGIDGSGAEQAFVTANTVQYANPYGVAVDAGHLYFTNGHTSMFGGAGDPALNSLGRAGIDGSDTNQSFIAGARYPIAVAVDSTHIYWANYGINTIGRADLDGGNIDQNFVTGVSGAMGLALNGQHIYWVNYANGTIGRADLDGTGVNQSLVSGLNSPRGIAIDGRHLYWSNRDAGTISRADLNGTNLTSSFITGANTPWGVAVTPPDTQAPTTQIDSAAAALSSDHSPAFTFSSDDPASTFECRIEATWTACSSPKAYTALADGSYSFEVRATDLAGNTDPNPPSSDFTIDTEAPDTQIDSGPSGSSDDDSPEFAFSAGELNSSFECSLDSGAWSACISPQSYSALADGPHSFEVRATDEAGNTDATPSIASFSIDTTVTPPDTTPPDPTPPATTPPDVSPPETLITARSDRRIVTGGKKVSVQIVFESEAGATFTCRVNGSEHRPCSSPFAVEVGSKRGEGRLHTIRIRATDQAGNREVEAARVRFRVARR